MVERKVCAIPLCVAFRAKDSYVCAAHSKDTTHHNGLAKQPKAHKFGAVPTTVGDIRFDSKAEAAHYSDLLLLEKAGEIVGLQLQPEFKLHVNGVFIGTYRADFSYWRNGVYIVDDVKGVKTPMFRWKAKHLKAEYGITVLETT